MSVAHPVAHAHDPYRLGHGGGHGSEAQGHGEGGAPSKRIIVGYGFWIFLLSDIIMFSAFFAAYAVLAGQTAGGPGAKQLFDVKNVGVETGFLLLSSFTCGVAKVVAKGFRADIMRRILCFSLFWHALDIIWVAVFTVVYLMGVVR